MHAGGGVIEGEDILRTNPPTHTTQDTTGERCFQHISPIGGNFASTFFTQEKMHEIWAKYDIFGECEKT